MLRPTRPATAPALAPPHDADEGALRARAFPGDGECARRCRALDWAATPLGPVAAWPAALRTTVALCLGVRQAMLVVWGDAHVMLYNDAYAALMGPRHPMGLGRPNAEVFPEFVAVNVPLFRRVLGGETLLQSEVCYPLDRTGAGTPEDAWFALSWSPVAGDDGTPAGVCVLVAETTDEVRGRALRAERERALDAERAARRRTEQLQALTARLAAAVTTVDVARTLLEVGVPALGAAGGAVLRWAADADDVLEILWSAGLDVPELAQWARFPLALPAPITDAIRADAPVSVASAEEVAARYPALAPLAAAIGCGGWLAAPFAATEGPDGAVRRVLGGFGIAFRGDHAPHPDDEALLLAFAQVATQALDRASAYEATHAARAAAERARTRAERLRDVVAALSGARDADAVYDVLVREARAALGAHAGAVAVLDDGGDALRFVRWFGYPDGVMGEWLRVPLAADTPLTDAVRAGTPEWVATRAALAERWPHFVAAGQAVPTEAWAALPLVLDGRTLGALALSFPEPRPADPATLAHAQALVGHCAQALGRARLFDAERAARAEAEAANRAKSDFLATMSHELRTPLNAIAGHVDLLDLGVHGPLADAQRDALSRIRRAQRHLLALITDVLDFARVEAGRVTYGRVPVPLAPLARDVARVLEASCAARGLTLDLALGDGADDAPGGVALADADRVAQVLFNLLGNAAKFTPAGGRITVTLRPGRAAGGDDAEVPVALTVHDTGIGIAADRHAAIFEPFVQVQAGLTRAHGGTGLGLAIARELARGMGGDLTVHSAAGAGSAFTLHLPVAPTGTAAPDSPGVAPPR